MADEKTGCWLCGEPGTVANYPGPLPMTVELCDKCAYLEYQAYNNKFGRLTRKPMYGELPVIRCWDCGDFTAKRCPDCQVLLCDKCYANHQPTDGSLKCGQSKTR